MRRTIPSSLAATAPLASPPARKEDEGLDVTLTLRALTPIVGGGVEAGRPDKVDIVRVPGIRGHLRSFWRALGDETDHQELRRRERDLWGGVPGVGEDSASTKASRVGVQVRVRDRDRGVSAPAGYHVTNASGQLKAQAEWDQNPTVNRALGYALFPLQINEEDRRTRQHEGRVPTGEWRRGAVFDVRITCPGNTSPLTDPGAAGELDRLLGALWWWVHFGGIGARTSRGFGALAIDNAKGLPLHWRSRFEAPSADQLRRWLAAAPTPRALAGPDTWRTLRRHEFLFARRPEPTPERAHIAALAALREFRQGVGVGRAQGKTRQEGQSHWPEAHMMRLVAEREWGIHGRWEHPPPRGRDDDFKRNGTWAAPRAAFGLPLGIQFKDRGEKAAGGWIHMSRFPSPLRLRPLALKDGNYAAVCLLLAGRPDTEALVVTQKMSTGHDDKVVKIDWQIDPAKQAAGEPLRPFLGPANGDAVKAFAIYLEKRLGFERVKGLKEAG